MYNKVFLTEGNMSFFKQMITAIYKFKEYPRLMLMSTGKTAGYIVIFSLLVCIVSQIPMAVGYYRIGGISGLIRDHVPEFSIKNGKLSCESIDFSDEMMGVKIYVDNNEDVNNIDTTGLTSYLLADSDKMIFGNNIQKSVIEFSQFGSSSFDKQGLINLFSGRKMKLALLIIYGVTALMGMCISTLFSLLSLAVIAMCVNSVFIHTNMGFGGALKLSVYARTFPVLLTLIFGLAGMSNFIVYWALQITYIYLGLKNIKKQEAIILAEL